MVDSSCVLCACLIVSTQGDKTRKQWLSFTGVETAMFGHLKKHKQQKDDYRCGKLEALAKGSLCGVTNYFPLGEGGNGRSSLSQTKPQAIEGGELGPQGPDQ